MPIELATAWLRVMSPEQVLQRLTDRFALLTRGSRSAPPRQQTLRVCIDWSHDLCTPAEQRVWARLSVFAGGFGLEAAQYVCGDPAEDLLDTVASLVDKSILTREEAGTEVGFGMLDTVRDYGREKARETGEYLEICRRHRDWCERLALDANAGFSSTRALEWVGRLRRERPNLRQALEFSVSESPDVGIRIAAAVWPFWFSQGSLGEGRRWLDRLLALRTGELTTDQAGAFYAACLMAAVQGDLAAAAGWVRQGRALVEETTDPGTRARIDFAEGVLALFSGNPSAARPHLEKAVEVSAEDGDVLFQIDALTNLGAVHDLGHDTEKAVECYEHALALTDDHGEAMYRPYVLWSLAVASWRGGDLARATGLLAEALRVNRTVKDRTNASMCLRALAWIATEEQEAERAVVLMAAAEQIGRSVGTSPIWLADLLPAQAEWERRTRQAMSEQAYAAAWREGAALGFDAAIAYALGGCSLDS